MFFLLSSCVGRLFVDFSGYEALEQFLVVKEGICLFFVSHESLEGMLFVFCLALRIYPVFSYPKLFV